eukprot:scaffold168712_cov31-Tisochrysis_lutea.AAC.3
MARDTACSLLNQAIDFYLHGLRRIRQYLEQRLCRVRRNVSEMRWHAVRLEPRRQRARTGWRGGRPPIENSATRRHDYDARHRQEEAMRRLMDGEEHCQRRVASGRVGIAAVVQGCVKRRSRPIRPELWRPLTHELAERREHKPCIDRVETRKRLV